MRILVVTDKFPPNAVGGAEISLHTTLKLIQSLSEVDIHVAVLDVRMTESDVNPVTFDGFQIHYIAPLKDWPPTMPRLTPTAKSFGRLAWPKAALSYALSSSYSSPAERYEKIQLYRRLSKHGHLNWRPMFDRDLFENSETVRQLGDLVERIRPDVSHADNYRSICALSFIDLPKMRKIAFVRDNRFVCPKQSQSFVSKNGVCGVCKADCLSPDVPMPEQIKKYWDQDMAFRTETLNSYSLVLTSSQFIRTSLLPRFPGSKIEVVGNPCDLINEVDHYQKGCRQAHPPEILVVGMLNANKGSDRVVDWLTFFKESLDDFRIVMAGRGQIANALSRRAAELGLSDHLIMAGFLDRESIYRAYARSSVVVAPNRWAEPFGRVPLEAGLSRRPFVGYAIGGVRESIVHEETGLLASPGDEAELLTLTLKCIKNPDFAKQLGENGRTRITQEYAPQTIAQRILDHWKASVPLGQRTVSG